MNINLKPPPQSEPIDPAIERRIKEQRDNALNAVAKVTGTRLAALEQRIAELEKVRSLDARFNELERHLAARQDAFNDANRSAAGPPWGARAKG